MKKRLLALLLSLALLLGMAPAVTMPAKAIDNSNLSFTNGNQAYCPACRNTVTWQAVSGELTATKWLQSGGHYYLSGDVTYAGTDQAMYSPTGSVSRTACLHLNGHNITATAGKAIQCGDGTLNVMGNGTVSGAGTAYGGATIHTWGSGTLNLYGGTYTKGASNYPALFVGSYTVNLHDGATVEGQGTTPGYYALVYLESNGAVFNMHGGAIQNGSSAGTCGNLKAYQGTINILGGTIQNGIGNTGGNVHVYNTAKLNISGGNIQNGSVCSAVSGAATLSGAPVISELAVPAGITVNLGSLTGGSIGVKASGVFTNENANASQYAKYFTAVDEGMCVEAQGNTLTVVEGEVEPLHTLPPYMAGNVLYQTDFEGDTVGAMPSGWSAGYMNSPNPETNTSYGWTDSATGSMTAQVAELEGYGKVYRFKSVNADAFTAMPEIPTTNYLYEAKVYVAGKGGMGIATNFYAPTYDSTGALFNSIYPGTVNAAKYTYKGTFYKSQNWDISANPAVGEIVELKLLSLNGKNYIIYNDTVTAIADARLTAMTKDHPGFYVCGGNVNILEVKVTEVFAADLQVVSGSVTAQPDTVTVQIDFDKNQGIYKQLYTGDYTFAEDAPLQFGAVAVWGAAEELTRETEDALQLMFTEGQQTEDLLRFTVNYPLTAAERDQWFTVRPFALAGDVCFYGQAKSYQPASLANGAYRFAKPAQKEALLQSFGAYPEFTAGKTGTMTFTLFSDFHYKKGMYPATISDLRTILERADAANAEFILSAGDFTNDMKGSPELYNTYRQFETSEGKILPAYNVYGNHELEFGNSMETVTWTLTNEEYTDHQVVWGTEDGSFQSNIGYYYFDRQGFRIVALDSEHSYNPTTGQYEHNKAGSSGSPSGNTKAGSLGPTQLEWLANVLADAADLGLSCIVVAHDGFGPDWCDTSPDAEAVRTIYSRVNKMRPGTVLMSINGHIHTDHQGWMDGVFYLDTNTVRNNWWQETAVAHYTDEHTFQYEEYDDAGNLLSVTAKKLSDLTMGAKTWFSQDPISCNVTVSKDGSISIDGVKSQWLYGIEPTTAADGVECEITSGSHWNCDLLGHDLELEVGESSYRYVCKNSICGYATVPTAHEGYLDMRITAVTLRPSAAGLYYKARFDADPATAAKVKNYGVVLSLSDLPGADFRTEEDINRATVAAVPFASGVEVTSGSVFGILKESSRSNIARSQMKIYANVYVELEDGTILVGDADSGAAWSLREVLDAIGENYESLSTADQQAFDHFLDYWNPYISES